MILDNLKPCCERPDIGLLEITYPPTTPIIMPERNIRIMCRNCGKVSPFCRDVETAAKFWNGESGGAE